MEHDLDDLSVVVAGELDGPDVVFADVPALTGYLCGEAHRGVGFGVL